jgi:hypothetical protein
MNVEGNLADPLWTYPLARSSTAPVNARASSMCERLTPMPDRAVAWQVPMVWMK